MKSRIFLTIVLALALTAFMASLGLAQLSGPTSAPKLVKEMARGDDVTITGPNRVIYHEGPVTHILTATKAGAVIDTVAYAPWTGNPADDLFDVLDYPTPYDSVIIWINPAGVCSLVDVAGNFHQTGTVKFFASEQDMGQWPSIAIGPNLLPTALSWNVTADTWSWLGLGGYGTDYQPEIAEDQVFMVGYRTDATGGPQINWCYPYFTERGHWYFTYGHDGHWYYVGYNAFTLFPELQFMAVLNYYAGTHPVVANTKQLSEGFKTTDFDSVTADVIDLDGTVESAVLFYTVEGTGMTTSVAMDGTPVHSGTVAGMISGTYSPGDVIDYWVVATDDDARTGEGAVMSYTVTGPQCPGADILFINAGAVDPDFYLNLDVLHDSYCVEYWDLAAHGGIHPSVINFGWKTIMMVGFGAGVIPTRDYTGNLYAEFLDNGGKLFYIDMDYMYVNGEPDNPFFAPGDFAYDYLGIEEGYNDPAGWFGWGGDFDGVPGDPITNDFATDGFHLDFSDPWLWGDFTWAPTGGADIFTAYGVFGAGQRNTNGIWHTVYLPWNLEGAGVIDPDGVGKANQFLKNVFEYFGTKRPIVVDIGEVEDAYPCDADVQIPVTVTNCPDIGGYNVLIHWDCTLAELLDVTDNQGFEFFNWTTWQVDDGCKVRIVGLADKPNDVPTDPLFGCEGEQTLFTLHFHPSNTWDLNYSIPITFETDECGDNVFSDPTGYILYTTSADCPEVVPEGKPDPFNPAVTLLNGYISAEYLNRYEFVGDINLNGTKYEVADATLYLEYLKSGDPSMLIDPDKQRTASDINIDGTPWSIADVVLLIDIINGYATPLAKALPTTEVASVSISGNAVAADFDVLVGGAYFVIKHAGQVTKPVLGARAEDMDLAWSDKDGELRVILYSWESTRIEPGSGVLFTVPGATNLTTSEVQFSDAHGSLMKVGSVPSEFALAQNYPNPFNPNTNIAFDLPTDANVSLTVYNITGQKVAELVNGQVKAGHHTVTWNATGIVSGVYFYKITAGDFTATRKMVLMK